MLGGYYSLGLGLIATYRPDHLIIPGDCGLVILHFAHNLGLQCSDFILNRF